MLMLKMSVHLLVMQMFYASDAKHLSETFGLQAIHLRLFNQPPRLGSHSVQTVLRGL